jgi:hypothetical protein
MQDVSVRGTWRAVVITRLRSRVDLTLLAIGLCVTVWQFWVGHVLAGSVVVAGLAFRYLCVGAGFGLWLGLRGKRLGA